MNLTLKFVVWILRSMVNQHIQQQHMVMDGTQKAISECPTSKEEPKVKIKLLKNNICIITYESLLNDLYSDLASDLFVTFFVTS